MPGLPSSSRVAPGFYRVHSRPEVRSRSKHPSARPPVPRTDIVTHFPPVILRCLSPRDHDPRRTGQLRQPRSPRLSERSVGNGATIDTIVGSVTTAEDATRSQRMNTLLIAKRAPLNQRHRIAQPASVLTTAAPVCMMCSKSASAQRFNKNDVFHDTVLAPRRRRHRRLRKKQWASYRMRRNNRVEFKVFRRAQRRLEISEQTRNVMIQTQPKLNNIERERHMYKHSTAQLTAVTPAQYRKGGARAG